MKLIDVTEASIKQFAGSTIYGRGYGYYEDDMVLSLDYDEDGNTIDAEVAGSDTDYEVQISGTDNDIDAYCSCPYEGWPCKHMVAVLLTLIHQKEKHLEANKKRKKTDSSLASKIRKLSKNELEELVIAYSRKYPDVKRELMLRLETDKKTTLKTIEKQINNAFMSVTSGNYSTSKIANKISAIIRSVKDASPEIQARIYWTAADAAIEELDEYGMYDNPLEDLAIDTVQSLVALLNENTSLQPLKTEIIDKLMEFYRSGNNGITDFLYESAYELCSEASHYQVMIARLKNSKSSYDQDLLADWYARVGDTDAQRRTLESKLEYGMDYWRLAQYWFDRGDDKKGIEVVLDGIAKGQGRKKELYEALQKHHQKKKDYKGIFKLLERKLEKNELDKRNVKSDGTYQFLWGHYSKANNYEQLKKILELCLASNEVDLHVYKQAEQVLNEDDWSDFRGQIITNLQERITKKQKARNPNYGFLCTLDEIATLAEIFHYANDADQLLETIKGNFQLIQQYESMLLPKYPDEYLAAYKHHINGLIEARGRKNYQEAVPYVKKVKQIHTKVLKNTVGWKEYIAHLRRSNKTLRALQEELAGVD